MYSARHNILVLSLVAIVSTIGTAQITRNRIKDDAYGAGWNGDRYYAPSRNAIFDVLNTMTPLADPNFTGIAAVDPNDGDAYYHDSGGTFSSFPTTAYTRGVMAAVDANEFGFGPINPRNSTYGAKGDGTADDTTSLQNAINAGASNRPVALPPGIYRVTSALDIPLGTHLRGYQSPGLDPNHSTVIWMDSNTPDMVLNLAETQSHSIEISHLTIRGPGKTASDCNGIAYDGAGSVYASHFHHLQLRDLGGDGFYFKKAFSFTIDNITTKDLDGWAYNGDAGPGSAFRDWTYVRADTGGLYIWDGSPIVSSINMEDVAIGLKFGSDTEATSCTPIIDTINIEPFTDTGILFERGRPRSMQGVTMYAAAGTAVNYGVSIESGGYGDFTSHCSATCTAKAGGTYTNQWYADSGAVSTVCVVIYDDPATIDINANFLRDAIIVSNERGNPSYGGEMHFSGKVAAGYGLETSGGSISAGFVDFLEDSSHGTDQLQLFGPAALAENAELTLPDSNGVVVAEANLSHDYGGGTSQWYLTGKDATGTVYTLTNAGGAVAMTWASVQPGRIFVVYNNAGATITVKVTGQTGFTVADGKYAIGTFTASDTVEIYEQP